MEMYDEDKSDDDNAQELSLGDKFSKELFDAINEMIEEKKLSMENAIYLLKLLGYDYAIKNDVGEKLYLNEIKEIIQYHQEHRNLTRHAYQSIWGFLIYRSLKDESLEEVVVNDLLFVKEATREIEELSQCVDWKRKEEEERKKETEVKEVLIIRKWIDLIDSFLSAYKLENEVNTVLIGSIVGVLREAKGHHIEICKQCIYLFEAVVRNEAVTVDDMLKRESVEAVLEGIQQPGY
ncbi:uncharacterized protein MONOS_7747 [Monocercomonoides exilis]|uniref:uncharacterized protein n=1 Tax=Monocercomonoides exilis TaxID=2049356 RepID=UPI0035595EF1|nr:hypothetical protein MONOS_7747 [Monocercomonoides exilis]|eukprot:MONOS_7747.1-p1 / transcript=MONOS_7747.1 / gene=MONOS_7747 / organism=Monocercomonoides_exilis_PA203 / gene_product=unspecified product / transcript_product=unspecified product / location=Mono_scaffold00273:12730-14000(-) / protein_length=236 / sequence_SO=supercontig / SO=protein_coding / is_pseudo=false